MQPKLKGSGQLQPDNETKTGRRVDKTWPGLVHSVWSYGPVEVRRERKFRERKNRNVKLEGWLVILRVKRHRIGIKWERDV